MPRLADLDPETRAQVRRTALAEISHFGTADDPALIERLAEAGRAGCAEQEAGAWVSEAPEELAAELRERQRQMAAACGALGSLVRVMVGR